MNNILRKLIIIVFMLSTTLTFPQYIELLSFKYDPFTDGNGGGIYEKLLYDILEEHGIKLVVSRSSIVRSIKKLEKRDPKQIMFVGDLYKGLHLQKEYELINFITLHKTFLFNHNNRPKWLSTPPSFSELKVALLHNEAIPTDKLSEKNIVRVENNATALKMLKYDRVDFFYSAKESITTSMELLKINKDNFSFTTWHKPYLVDIGIMIHRENKEVIVIVQDAVNEINSN